MFSLPKVNVNASFIADPVVTLSPEVKAQPSLPLPPAPDPGTPEPAYVALAFNHPFKPLVLSI